jgi:hypothetical protein
LERQERKRLSKSLCEKMQRPFSFYKRDIKKNKKFTQKEEEPYRIFATPIPETSRNNFYQLI